MPPHLPETHVRWSELGLVTRVLILAVVIPTGCRLSKLLSRLPYPCCWSTNFEVVRGFDTQHRGFWRMNQNSWWASQPSASASLSEMQSEVLWPCCCWQRLGSLPGCLQGTGPAAPAQVPAAPSNCICQLLHARELVPPKPSTCMSE